MVTYTHFQSVFDLLYRTRVPFAGDTRKLLRPQIYFVWMQVNHFSHNRNSFIKNSVADEYYCFVADLAGTQSDYGRCFGSLSWIGLTV